MAKAKKKPATTATKLPATKFIKATTKKTLSDKLKTATRDIADKRKKHVLRNSVQSDTQDITPGQEENTPTLYHEGLSCAVEVHSTRGSLEGELLLRKKQP